MKHLKILFFIILFSFASSALATGWKSLEVDLREADPFIIDLSETLSLELRDGSIVISDDRIEFEFDRQDIVSFTHRTTPFNISTGTGHITESTHAPSLILAGSEVKFSGFKEGCVAEVFSLSGQRLTSITFDSELTLPMDYVRTLIGKGGGNDSILIMTAGGISMKINVRL